MILDKQAEIEEIYRRYLEPEPTAHERASRSGGASTAPGADTATLLEHMFASKNGADIRRLYDGDTHGYQSPSEADLAWIGRCAWWADYDPQLTEELAKQGALYRAKWDELRGEQTYLQITVAKACEGKGPGDGYRPKQAKKQAAKEKGKRAPSPSSPARLYPSRSRCYPALLPA